MKNQLLAALLCFVSITTQAQFTLTNSRTGRVFNTTTNWARIGAGRPLLRTNQLPAFSFPTNLQPILSIISTQGIAPARVANRSANGRAWERITIQTNSAGGIFARTNIVTEIQSGLHRRENDQWIETDPEITLTNGGAAGIGGAHRVWFAADLSSSNAIQVLTPDDLLLRSRILGLSFYDYQSQSNVMIAELKESIGTVIGLNLVVYSNAFTDLRADVHYTYSRAGLEQDIVLRQRPPSPEDFGLNPDTTRLEVWTEFFDPPQPIRHQSVRKQWPEAAQDKTLDFGSMSIGVGTAFALGQNADRLKLEVNKEWVETDKRFFLVEDVSFKPLRSSIRKLPIKGQASIRRPSPGGSLYVVSTNRILPHIKMAMVDSTNTIQRVQADRRTVREAGVHLEDASSPALVLDYAIVNSSSNFVFKAGSTYYISGAVNLTGTNNIEGGSVIKFDTNAQLNVLGYVQTLTGPYKPAVLTAKDDDTVGDILTNSTGVVTGRYASVALSLQNGGSLDYLRILHASTALSSLDTIGISNFQVLHCDTGISIEDAHFAAENVLMFDVFTNFGGRFFHGTAEQITSHKAGVFADDRDFEYYGGTGEGLASSTITLNNSLVVSVTNGYGVIPVFTNSVNVYTNDSGVFKTVGGGMHYLADGSTNRAAGTAAINSNLLASIKSKTTFSPVLWENLIWGDTNLALTVPRDINPSPDLGYHYDPLDYMLAEVSLQGTLTLVEGGSIGFWGASGLGFEMIGGSTLISQGSVGNPNRLVRYNTVQEDQAWGSPDGGIVQIEEGDVGVNMSCRFTEFSLLPGPNGPGSIVSVGFYGTDGTFSFRDCQFTGGDFSYNSGYFLGSQASLQFNNCLFLRTSIEPSVVYDTFYFSAYNNLFRGISLYLGAYYGDASFVLKDNIFEETRIIQDIEADASYNAYFTNSARLLPTNSNDLLITNLSYQTGPFGQFYQPGGSPLIDHGSRTADQAGLYHYTVLTNDTKELSSTVDIGLHYVASTAGNGIPVDTDGDGIPDYVEDSNGDGVWEVMTESSWTNAVDPLAACQSAPTGLIGWWKAETNALDATGTNHGMAYNGVSYAVGPVGSAFSFDGVDDHVRVTNTPALRSTNGLTAEAWVYLDHIGNYSTIITKWDAVPDDYQKSFDLDIGPDGIPYIVVSATGGDDIIGVAFASHQIIARQWTHIAGTYDGSSLSIYMDGQLDGQIAYSEGIFPGTNDLGIGGCVGGDAPGDVFSVSVFKGLIDEVSLYNRGLTSAEIQSIYLAGRTGKCPLPPAIVVQPVNQYALVGGNAAFSISVQGAEPLSYQWQFDGANIPSATNGALFLSDVQSSNIGNYSVIVTNAYGAITSSVATLDILSLQVVSGDNQIGSLDAFLPQPFTVLVTTSDSTPVPNASISFAVDHGAALLAAATNAPLAGSITIQTGEDGQAAAWIYFPASGYLLFNSISAHLSIGANIIGAEIQASLPGQLAHFRFDDTNTWAGDDGQLPVIATNVLGVLSRNTNAAAINTTNPAILSYRVLETNGHANISFPSGSVRFWFKPDWATAYGAGPQNPGTLLEIGNFDPAFTNAWWCLSVSPGGDQLGFASSGTKGGDTNFSADVSWNWCQPHQIVLTYSPDTSALYIDGEPVNTDGSGVPSIVASAFITNYFRIGGDSLGTNQARGVFDELETFNYPLSDGEVAAGYTPAQLPTITIITPTNGSEYLVGSDNILIMPITVDAESGPGRSIVSVDYNYVYDNLTSIRPNYSLPGSIPIGTSTTYPFSINWENDDWEDALSEHYKIHATAIDDTGIASESAQVAVRVSSDSDDDGIPDWWMFEYFGHPTGQSGDNSLANQDSDGDGKTNLREYLDNTSPLDYFNGNTSPRIRAVSGDNQLGFTNAFLPVPLIVSVTDDQANALTNAPISFFNVSGDAQVALSSNDPPVQSVELRTDSRGTATVWVYLGFPSEHHFPLNVIGVQVADTIFESQQYVIEYPARLGLWHFDSTNWLGENGQVPVAFTNVTLADGIVSNGMQLDNVNPALLAYSFEKPNGEPNILPWYGSVLFWFKPDWGSAGPEEEARLIEIGGQTNGWWALLFSSDGKMLKFATETGANSAEINLLANINWNANEWHQIALTYSPTHSLLYIDGRAISYGLGVSQYPDIAALTNGFFIGGSTQGTNLALGAIDELLTVNYQLTPQEVGSDYATKMPPPTLTLAPTNDGLKLIVSLNAPRGDEIFSPVTEIDYPTSVSYLLTECYADTLATRFIGVGEGHAVGLNVTKLPPPSIDPASRCFNYPSNIVIRFGAENLTNLVSGMFQSELARLGSLQEIQSITDLAWGLRTQGFSDEDIRTNLVNGSYFRGSQEYTNKFGGPGAIYVANNDSAIEYSLNGGASWSLYNGPIEVTSTVTIQARVRKSPSSDQTTAFAFLTSQTVATHFDFLPASWLISNFGEGYETNANALPAADPDGDGLNNLEEYNAGTNPNFADSDSDGVSDGAEIVAGSDPQDGSSTPRQRLGYWRFNSTTWLGEEGQVPLVFTNLAAAVDWSGTAVCINNTNPAYLAYRDVETNGAANIVVTNGSLRFWFKGDWNSSTTNAGTGPGSLARLIEMGGEASPDGWWALFVDSFGTTLSFVTQTNGLYQTNLTASINWTSNDWHQIVLTYTLTNSLLYLDGQPTASGTGIARYPNSASRATGLFIGSDNQGLHQAMGQFDELETFNYPISALDIATNYDTIDPGGAGPIDYIGWLQGRNPAAHGASIPDTNGLVNLEVYTPLR